MFKKWPSIENSYRDKFIRGFVEEYPGLKNATFIVTEKIHGANVSIFCEPDGDIQVASRNHVLSPGDKFYDIWNVLPKYKDVCDFMFAVSVATDKTCRIFGEYFGGSVQKGVDYGPEHKILFFGMMLSEDLLPYSVFYDYMNCGGVGCLVVPTVAVVNGLDAAIAIDAEFDSLVIDKDDNLCEGVVIQPLRKVYYRNDGKLFILKKKNEAFKERQKEKPQKPVNTEVERLNWTFQEYITDNRLQGIFSKNGEIQEPKQIGQYIRLLLLDAQKDFAKDHPEITEMSKNNQKSVYNVGSMIANMLKGYL